MSARFRAFSFELACAVVTLAAIWSLIMLGAHFTVWLVRTSPRSVALAAAVVCMVASMGILIGADRFRRYRFGKWVNGLALPVSATAIYITYGEGAVAFGFAGAFAGLSLAIIDNEVQKRRRRQ